jgi:hypothetical protein
MVEAPREHRENMVMIGSCEVFIATPPGCHLTAMNVAAFAHALL